MIALPVSLNLKLRRDDLVIFTILVVTFKIVYERPREKVTMESFSTSCPRKLAEMGSLTFVTSW